KFADPNGGELTDPLPSVGVDAAPWTNPQPDWQYDVVSDQAAVARTNLTTSSSEIGVGLSQTALSTNSLQVSGLDLLTNIGPRARFLGVRRDAVPPTPVIVHRFTSPTNNITLSWDATYDVGPAGMKKYNVYRA